VRINEKGISGRSRGETRSSQAGAMEREQGSYKRAKMAGCEGEKDDMLLQGIRPRSRVESCTHERMWMDSGRSRFQEGPLSIQIAELFGTCDEESMRLRSTLARDGAGM
jgi:hypothetical protein